MNWPKAWPNPSPPRGAEEIRRRPRGPRAGLAGLGEHCGSAKDSPLSLQENPIMDVTSVTPTAPSDVGSSALHTERRPDVAQQHDKNQPKREVMNDKCFGLAKNLARLFACRRVMQLRIVTFRSEEHTSELQSRL